MTLPDRDAASERPRGRRLPRRAGRAVGAVLAVGGLVAGAVLSLRPPGDGPLDGGSGAGVTLGHLTPGTRMSFGLLLLMNTGPRPVVVRSVEVVPGGGGLVPAGPARVSGPERIAVLGDAGFISLPGEPPAGMPLTRPSGYVVPPGDGRSVEVVYTVVVPQASNSWIEGVDVRYSVGVRTYTERFRSVVSLCTPAFVGTCPDHA